MFDLAFLFGPVGSQCKISPLETWLRFTSNHHFNVTCIYFPVDRAECGKTIGIRPAKCFINNPTTAIEVYAGEQVGRNLTSCYSWVVSFRVSFKRKVKVLLDRVLNIVKAVWIIESEIHLFKCLVLVIKGDTGSPEVVVIVIERHPEDTIIGILPSDFLFQGISPVRVIVPPRTRVVFVVPWIAHLCQHEFFTIVLDRFHIEKTIGVTWDQSISFCAYAAAASSHRHILRCIVFKQW